MREDNETNGAESEELDMERLMKEIDELVERTQSRKEAKAAESFASRPVFRSRGNRPRLRDFEGNGSSADNRAAGKTRARRWGRGRSDQPPSRLRRIHPSRRHPANHIPGPGTSGSAGNHGRKGHTGLSGGAAAGGNTAHQSFGRLHSKARRPRLFPKRRSVPFPLEISHSIWC